jgi:peroxiredoxin
MVRRGVFRLALVLVFMGTACAQIPIEVNLGWIRLSDTDHGWRVEHIRELGDWNLPLLEGDVLSEIRGHDASLLNPISVAALLTDALTQKISVAVERNGRRQQFDVLASDQDSAASEEQSLEQYGIGLQLRAGVSGGVTVLGVVSGSPADKAGLRKDDKILAIDDKDVSTLPISQVSEMMLSDRPSTLKLRVLRFETEFTIPVNRVSMRDLYPQSNATATSFPIHKKGELAPTFELMNTQGRRVALEDFRGKWVLLNFWGVWCPICHVELPFLDAWKERYGDGLAILALDINDKPEVLQRYLSRHTLSYQVLIAGQLGQPLANSYGLRGLPLNVVIDPKGEVRYVEVGFEPASPKEPPPLDAYLRSIQQRF